MLVGVDVVDVEFEAETAVVADAAIVIGAETLRRMRMAKSQ